MTIHLVGYLILFFGVINLFRLAMLLIGSDLYGLFHHLRRKKESAKHYLPTFSVVIPAHNEERTIIRCLSSVLNNDYPKDKLEVVVVDDGSTDKTSQLVKNYKKKNQIKNLKIVKQENAGKAHALNNGIKNHTQGELVMCLDSDSYLAKEAIKNATRYFQDPKVMAVASNVKIIDTGSLLNLIQKFEYLICYQMKRAQTLFNVEYIIGGIGSTIRRKTLEKVRYYDTNTVTEDIDITMKILRNGNKNFRVTYGADVIAYTESVLDFAGLIRQRYRWKWGRCQTFLKNKEMFLNPDRKFTKGLTYFYLPFAIFCDFAFLWEPLILGYILYISTTYRDALTILSALCVVTGYICLNILAEETITNKDKAKLLLLAPTMYVYFYILSLAEYVALIKATLNLKNLKRSIEEEVCNWQHVERPSIGPTKI